MLSKRCTKEKADWTDTKYLGVWLDNFTYNAGDIEELQIAIVSNGVVQPKIKIIINSMHQWFQIDMEAANWNRIKVESLRIYCKNVNEISNRSSFHIECWRFNNVK